MISGCYRDREGQTAQLEKAASTSSKETKTPGLFVLVTQRIVMAALQMHLGVRDEEGKLLFKVKELLGINHMGTHFGIKRQYLTNSAKRF